MMQRIYLQKTYFLSKNSINLLPSILLLFLFMHFFPVVTFATAMKNPCEGPYEVITLTNRGGIAESPCAIPFGKGFISGGYELQRFQRMPTNQNYPQGELRFGLPGFNELFIQPPNQNSQSNIPNNRLNDVNLDSDAGGPNIGSCTAGLGIKHQFLFSSLPTLIASLEGMLHFQGGSRAYGNRDLGIEATSIMLNKFSEKIETTLLLKIESISTPRNTLQSRYTNFTLGGVFNYVISHKIAAFVQTYGLTKVSPNNHGAWNAVVGGYYLLNKKVVMDMAFYRQLTQNDGQYKNAFNVGLSMEL